MPRKTPLNEREAGICRRLREFRRRTGLTRVVFAQKAGIDSSMVVRYEHGRVPLRYAHAWRFMRVYFISPTWLANGEGGAWDRAAGSIPGPQKLEAAEGALFSEVYDKVLAGAREKAGGAKEELSAGENRARWEWRFREWLEARLIELPDAAAAEFLDRFMEAGATLLKKMPKDTAERIARRREVYESVPDAEIRRRIYGTD